MGSAGGFWWLGCSKTWILLLLSSITIQGLGYWQQPGCHLVGYTEEFDRYGCVKFPFTSNACSGYCESLARPTWPDDLLDNPRQTITSIAQCCDMDETEDIIQPVQCVDGITEFTFKQAKSCICSQCKKD